jgi:hypothetical protein
MEPFITPLVIGIIAMIGFIALMTYSLALEDAQISRSETQEQIRKTEELTSADKKLAEEKLREFIQVDETGNGEFATISGVFNKNTGEVIDGRKRTSKQIDDVLRNISKSPNKTSVLNKR